MGRLPNSQKKTSQPQQPADPRIKYVCSRCGRSHPRQSGYFAFMQSPLYEFNNKYAHVCLQCMCDLYIEYAERLGSEEAAMERMCQKFDLFWSKDIYANTEKSSTTKPRILSYIKNCNLRQYGGRTYDTYLDEIGKTTIDTEEELQEAKDGGAKVSAASVKRWGLGFSVEEYKMADDLYQTLKSANPKSDGVQETYMRDLVKTKVLQQRAFEHGNADEYTKYMKAYQDTFKSSKLKMSTDDDGDMNDENVCWGKFIQAVEEYTPADLYTNKGIFDDVDGIKEYFNRFIVRPFRNFFTGSNDQDPEFSVLPGEEES